MKKQCKKCHGTGQTETTWYRPSPDFESRVMGIWPTSAVSGVWSDAIWSLAADYSTPTNPRPFRPQLPLPLELLPEIGCDCASHGDDYTAVCARWGDCGLKHFEANGWDHRRIADKLRDLAIELATMATKARSVGIAQGLYKVVRPEDIKIKIDDDGTGGGVITLLREYGMNVIPINSGSRATKDLWYPNKRSELWFQTRDRARDGHMDLSRLSPESLKRIKAQFMAVEYSLDGPGRRVVERKEITKKKCKRSPDSADCTNLAYYQGADYTLPKQPDIEKRPGIVQRVFGKQQDQP